MAFKRGFKTGANKIALRLREQMNLVPTDPIDLLEVCKHLEIEVIPLSKLRDADGKLSGHHFLHEQPGKFSAVLVPCGMRRAIVHNDTHAPYRQRSNMAHELAHCFLGHPLVPLLGADGERNRNSEIEEEATFLSGMLLIPNEAAVHIVASGMVPNAGSVYGVSKEMLEFRLRVSGARIIAARRANRGPEQTPGNRAA